jgi:hypothetical protein
MDIMCIKDVILHHCAHHRVDFVLITTKKRLIAARVTAGTLGRCYLPPAHYYIGASVMPKYHRSTTNLVLRG